jgi:hypothetical protein
MTTGTTFKSEQPKTMKLVEITMAAVRACRKTSFGFEKGCEQMTTLAEWGEAIARDTGPSNRGIVHIPEVNRMELKMNLKLIRVNKMWQMKLEANPVLHQF